MPHPLALYQEGPVVNWNFLQSQSLTSFSRTSNATMFDSTGKLTYAANNLLTNSNNFTNTLGTSLVNITPTTGVSDPFGGTNATTLTATANNAEIYQAPVAVSGTPNAIVSVYIRRRTGTGNITLKNPNDSGGTVLPVTSAWQQFYLSGPMNASGNYFDLFIATNGDAIDVYAKTYSVVTYETTPRSQDQVITTSTAYYGPRYPYAYNGSTWDAQGLLVEAAGTNVIPNSGTFSGWTTANAGPSPSRGIAWCRPDRPSPTRSGTRCRRWLRRLSSICMAAGGQRTKPRRRLLCRIISA